MNTTPITPEKPGTTDIPSRPTHPEPEFEPRHSGDTYVAPHDPEDAHEQDIPPEMPPRTPRWPSPPREVH